MTEKKISLKAVLHDLSLIIPPSDWNDYTFLEHASKAFRMIRAKDSFKNVVALVKVIDHSFDLPKDLVYVGQIARYTGSVNVDEDLDKIKETLKLPDNFSFSSFTNIPANNWEPVRLLVTPFASTIQCPLNIFPQTEHCSYQYTINSDFTGSTTLKEGIFLIAYQAYNKDEEGYFLIPDEEEVKEAIIQYCLWQFYVKKSIMKEASAFQMAEYYRRLWELMRAKAVATINSPSLDELENIRVENKKLKPRNHYNDLFTKFNNPE